MKIPSVLINILNYTLLVLNRVPYIYSISIILALLLIPFLWGVNIAHCLLDTASLQSKGPGGGGSSLPWAWPRLLSWPKEGSIARAQELRRDRGGKGGYIDPL